MTIKDLQEKYKLSKDDFWELKRGYNSVWIVTHDAVEKIAAIEKISLVDIKVLNSEWDFCRFLVTMQKEDKKETSIGEALLNDGSILKTAKKKGKDGKEYDVHTYKGNCESQYVGAMAEKRGKDRCILKLINAYEYGIYSDIEADDFKRGRVEQADLPKKPSQQPAKSILWSKIQKHTGKTTPSDDEIISAVSDLSGMNIKSKAELTEDRCKQILELTI